MRWGLLALLITGCAAYDWHKQQDISNTHVTKVESLLAPDFCTAFLGYPAISCAVWTSNRCVIVVRPNVVEDVSHESAHCLGWNH